MTDSRPLAAPLEIRIVLITHQHPSPLPLEILLTLCILLMIHDVFIPPGCSARLALYSLFDCENVAITYTRYPLPFVPNLI